MDGITKIPKLLIVDDDPIFTQTLKTIAPKDEFEVVVYNNPRDLYHDLPNVDFDIAIVDFNLGRVTGSQLANFMSHKKGDQPIVVVSGTGVTQIPKWSKNIKLFENKAIGAHKILSKVKHILQCE